MFNCWLPLASIQLLPSAISSQVRAAANLWRKRLNAMVKLGTEAAMDGRASRNRFLHA